MFFVPTDFTKTWLKYASASTIILSAIIFIILLILLSQTISDLKLIFYKSSLICGLIFITVLHWLGLRAFYYYMNTYTKTAVFIGLVFDLPICYWYIWHVLIYEFDAFLRIDQNFHEVIYYFTFIHMIVFFGFTLLLIRWINYLTHQDWLEEQKKEYLIKVRYLQLMEGVQENIHDEIPDYSQTNICFHTQFTVVSYLFTFFYVIVTFALLVYSARNYLNSTYLYYDQKLSQGNSAYVVICVTFAFLILAGVPFISFAPLNYALRQMIISFIMAIIYLIVNYNFELILPKTRTYLNTNIPTGTICLLVLCFIFEYERIFYKWAIIIMYAFFWIPLYVIYPLMDSEEISGFTQYTNFIYYAVLYFYL